MFHQISVCPRVRMRIMQEDIIRSALELYMTYQDLRNEEDQSDRCYGMTIMSQHFKEIIERNLKGCKLLHW